MNEEKGETAEAAAAAAPVQESMGEELERLQREGDQVKQMRKEAEEKERNEEEARVPKLLRDPGAPTEEEIEVHNTTHLPFRSWCPSCVAGKAKDKPHHRITDSNNAIPVIVFDYCFLGTDDAKENLAIQVMLDTRSHMMFAHVVPRRGMIDEHGAEEMVKDLDQLGYEEVILKCDEEPALMNVQNTVKIRRRRKTITENSPVGDSRANGKAERAVQTFSAHLRVLKKGLEDRCNLKFSSDHPLMTWLVEHVADTVSKYHVSQDGNTGCE